MEEQIFLDLLNKSMQDSVRQVRLSLGRPSSRATREEAIQQVAMLKTAVPSPELEKRIKDLLQDRLGGEIILHTETDPSIIGGFRLNVDDRLLDASVSSQLEEIRRQLIDKNRRIV